MRLIVLSVLPAFYLAAQQTGDVRAFGAAGDGAHDDSAAISSALAAAAAQGGSLYFPRGVYSFAAPLEIGRSGIHLVCESGAVLKFTGAGVAVSFASAAPAETTDVGVENCTIEGNPDATDGILLKRAHHVSLRNVRVRNVARACLRTRFSVIGDYTNFRCTANEPPFGTPAANGIVLGEDRPGEQTTASTFLNAIVEGVGADGIVLDSAANIVFTAGTSENNHAGWGMTIGPRSNNVTVIGMDFEDNASGSVDTAGSESLFVNLLAAGLFRVRSGGRGNTIANSRVHQVTFDAGSLNNVMRENDYAIENGRAEPVDRGSNNSIYANYNAGNQRYAAGYIRFPVDSSQGGALLVAAPAELPFRALRLGPDWSDVGPAASGAWRAVLTGVWSSGAGVTLTEATAAAPSAAIGGAAVTFRVNTATSRLEARTDGPALRFSGAVFVGAASAN